MTQNFYDQYTNYNYAVYPGICEPILQFGTNYSTNIVSKYQYSFLNVITNHYYTNALVELFITNIFLIPGGSPDQLGTNITVTSYYTNLPSGDFYIVPTNWCGYQITALLTNFITPTNIVLTNQTFGTGTITNQQYTFVEYLAYTNYTYSIRPGFCEPALAFSTNYSTNIVNLYSYTFGNVVTNSYYTNSPVTVITTNLSLLNFGLVGSLNTNISTVVSNTGVSGDFFIVPADWCGYKILSTLLTNVVYTTNTVTATNQANVNSQGQAYTQTTIGSNTNHTFLIQTFTCTNVVAPPALRQGIERIQFVRANFDSLIGQFFQPITNYYTMVTITNSKAVTEYYQRIITRPDIVFSADNQIAANTFNGTVTRNISYDTANVLPGLAGPGVINSPVTFSFNKIGDAFSNGSLADYLLTTNQFLSELTALPVLAWASYDSSTNLPVVYPNGNSIQNLQNEILVQITPTILANGTNNTAYPTVTFTATGGSFSPPFTWSATGVPAGMTVSSVGTLSGTPTAAGTFDITLQLTDSLGRSVQWFYTLIIQ